MDNRPQPGSCPGNPLRHGCGRIARKCDQAGRIYIYSFESLLGHKILHETFSKGTATNVACAQEQDISYLLGHSLILELCDFAPYGRDGAGHVTGYYKPSQEYI